MARFVTLLILLVPLSYAGMWLLDHPGSVTMQWLGYEVRLQIAVLIFGLAGLVFLLQLFFTLISGIIRTPHHTKQAYALKRKDKGITQLTHAFSALSVGDATTAQKHIQKAEKLLDHAPVTQLISAQLARHQNNHPKAIAYLESLTEHEDTALVGLHGLIEHAIANKQYAQASLHTEKAFTLQPGNAALARTRIEVLCRMKQWDAALDTISKAKRKKAITKETALHIIALIDLERAKIKAEHEPEQALALLKDALSKDKSLLPADILRAEITAKQDNRRKLAHFARSHWARKPHPHMAELFFNAYKDEKPATMRKRIEALTQLQAEDQESLLLRAKTAIYTADWAQARNLLKSALTIRETPRICTMMADIESREKEDEAAAKHWLERAVTAADDKSWVCNHCGHSHDAWQLFCAQCDSFDSIHWQYPERSLVTIEA